MPTSYPTIVPYADNRYISYTLTDQMSMLDDKLQVILGARYQDIDTKNLYKKTKYSSDKLSPSLGVVVKPFGEDLSFYASYVEGLSEGVTVSDITYPTATNQGTTFAPYQTKQYELGTKYQIGSWLNTLALYQIEKPEVYQDTISKAVKDDAETRSRGIELSTAGQLTEDLSLMANLAYIDAEYVKSGTASQVGNTVIGTPDFTAGLGLDYKIPVVEGLSVNGRASYISEQYLDTTNKLELPDYTIVDLGAKYATKIGGVNTIFRANVNNLTDEKYWEGVFNSYYATVGGARTYKLGVTFDF
jgi:iron complex outermembrane recepter protein